MTQANWTDPAVSFLTLMWPVASAAEIAAQLTAQIKTTFTKDMVIGKARRLKLPPIPSEERKRRCTEATRAALSERKRRLRAE